MNNIGAARSYFTTLYTFEHSLTFRLDFNHDYAPDIRVLLRNK